MHRLVAIIVIALLLAAPVAGASHWMLYHADIDDSAGWTTEPDDLVLHAPGHALDGARNRVTASGQSPGDGSLFLDAIVGQHVGIGSGLRGFDIYPGRLLGNGGDILFSGVIHFSAWYGNWSDHHEDGFIDDLHDGACGAAACPLDEFAWRGRATDESLAITLYAFGYGLYTPAQNRSAVAALRLSDETSPENPEQGWKGAVRWDTRGYSFLASYYTVAIASEHYAIGGTIPHDLADPTTLIDVDRYESLNPDVEALYHASILTYEAAYAALRDEATRAADEILGWAPVDDALAIYGAALGVYQDAFREGPGFATRTVNENTKYREPREPNHPGDDFEDRAFYGGVGDYVGTGNQYPGYLSEYAFYFDNVVSPPRCTHTTISIPALGYSTQITGACPPANTYEYEPQRHLADNSDNRAPGFLLAFAAYNLLWKDVNQDGHIGAVCDAEDPEQFDAEANACRNPPRTRPHTHGETINVCSLSSSIGSEVLVTPSQDWDGAILIRDLRLWPGNFVERFEVLEGRETVVLRNENQCDINGFIRTRDAILLPKGSLPGIVLVEASSSITGYTDLGSGINVGAQGVTDVDLLYPWL